MDISIKASNLMQNTGTNNNSSIMQNLMLQKDRLSQEKQKIDSNQMLSDEEKEKRLKNIENRMQAIDQRIKQLQQKQEKEQKKERIEEEAATLTLTMDSETAKDLLRLNKLMEMSVESDSLQESTISENMEMIAEALDEIGLDDLKSIPESDETEKELYSKDEK